MRTVSDLREANDIGANLESTRVVERDSAGVCAHDSVAGGRDPADVLHAHARVAGCRPEHGVPGDREVSSLRDVNRDVVRAVDDRSANDDTGAGERDSLSARAVAVKRGDDDRSARHVAARHALRAWRRHRVARDRDVRADPEQIAKRMPRAPNADVLPAGPTTV